MGLIIGSDSNVTPPHHGNRDTLSSRAATLIVLIVFLISATGIILVFAQYPDLDEYVCVCVCVHHYSCNNNGSFDSQFFIMPLVSCSQPLFPAALAHNPQGLATQDCIP